jgi:hypothetical protein
MPSVFFRRVLEHVDDGEGPSRVVAAASRHTFALMAAGAPDGVSHPPIVCRRTGVPVIEQGAAFRYEVAGPCDRSGLGGRSPVLGTVASEATRLPPGCRSPRRAIV